jgi:spore coat protein H
MRFTPSSAGQKLKSVRERARTLLFISSFLCASVALPTNSQSQPSPVEKPAQSDLSDAYYALDRILNVDIEISPTGWDSLRAQTRTLADILGGTDCLDKPADDIFSWFNATVTVDGETHIDVAVRKKGFLGSLSMEKPSLKIRFDKFVDDQLLGGVLKRLTLNNAQQDPSMINTCLSYQLFAQAGIPTPRCNFATLHVNGEDMGLYVQVESIKTRFLERNFADPTGNLYEGTLSDFRPDWRGTFEKKTNEGTRDQTDIDAVVNALQDPSPAGLAALNHHRRSL